MDNQSYQTDEQVKLRLQADINTLVVLANTNSKSHGFWEGVDHNDPTVLGLKCALIHSETSELLEAYRKDPKADCGKKFPDTYSDAEEDLTFSGGKFSGGAQRLIPGGPIGLNLEEEELADIIIRVLDLAGQRNIDLGRAVLVKMAYNSTRPHKHGKTC